MYNINLKKYFDGLISALIGAALLLSISTNLRSSQFPVGPGEILLFILAVIGFKLVRLAKEMPYSPLFVFWVVVGCSMFVGANLNATVSFMASHHAMAYAFTAFVSLGLSFILFRLNDVSLKKCLLSLALLSAVSLWFAFFVYMSGNVELITLLRIVDSGDARFSGWSSNPNQLALLFVPVPVWVAALWRDVDQPKVGSFIFYSFLLFALMLMGLLVRSDGLLVVWVFEFFILLILRFRWEKKASYKSLIGYALLMIACVLMVKFFAQGDVRKSINCTFSSIVERDGAWRDRCYIADAFKGDQAFRIGYEHPEGKTGVRKELWLNGFNIWLKAPVFGFGPGQYSSYLMNSDGLRSEILESHNITIDLLTQGGILAGMAWIVLVTYLLVKAWRIQDSYTFSVVLMMAAFTFFHNTRQPYLWFVLAMSFEAVRRRLFVSLSIDKA